MPPEGEPRAAAGLFRPCLLLAALLCTASSVAAERIASLNLCLDQLLLDWVDHERIVSVTWLSANDHYRRAPLPEHVALNRGHAEELLGLEPDLVLVGQYGAGRAAERLRQLGVRVVTIPDAYNLAQLQQQLQVLGSELGENAELSHQSRRLKQILQQPLPAEPVSAMILSANNITYGSGMLEHELLERAGFRNLAPELDDGNSGQLQRVMLEQVIAAEPDLLVLYGGEQAFALAHLAARHPVMRRYVDSGRVFTLPAELGFCPALVAADVLEDLKQKRESLVRQQ
ncbi:corrinoid ABC transporter substrate-binding protein [Microbulbifer aggregans]|uniref:Corrinoid ABC transporter substrate-binding protein n=1 Tax=Microbulbifer aggregans TaxID=1769779 RepID=A0A1C9W3T8_9GAMM|nr:ABC transporter substrate-binding protein [Microbulbifer aggregans]AOS95812.1 corrinoid ABC transporter substrate-binding protein [Microbulbifer aggregans]